MQSSRQENTSLCFDYIPDWTHSGGVGLAGPADGPVVEDEGRGAGGGAGKVVESVQTEDGAGAGDLHPHWRYWNGNR